MTTFLPPIVPSPLGKRFDCKPYHFDDGFSRPLPAANPSSASIGAVLVSRSRQISPISVASAPISLNNENASPSAQKLGDSLLLHRSRPRQVLRKASVPVTPAKEVVLTPTKTSPIPLANQGVARSRIQGGSKETEDGKSEDVVCRPLVDLVHASRRRVQLNAAVDTRCRPLGYFEEPQSDGDHDLNERPHTPSISPKRPGDGSDHTTPVADPLSSRQLQEKYRPRKYFSSPNNSFNFGHHRNRLSDTSSAFVHTVKTASLSNGSFSILPRSFRLGRSSETQGYASSHARFSIDSDRPPTHSSVDEAAVRRGVKRYQIIQELISSEESYLADVRALVYLYMTLLASTSSLSTQVTSSVQRDVTEILHLHEHLVGELHRMSLRAANRKWADTASPRLLGISHHLRWRSLDPNIAPRSPRKHRRTRSSLESAEVPQALARLQTADPEEVADVARIFRSSMSRLLVYEEYGAKYELIVSELHDNVSRWSSFETGIEALAKSLVALNSKSQDERKALTVKDLLVKPIQRVCRYPLLLQDLLRNTPVVDCPSAHADIESTLQCLKDIVQEIDHATDNHLVRQQIQRRWLLHERINFQDEVLPATQFRSLGHIQLCGVLHAAWNSKSRVDGCYSLCLLFETYFALALPAGATGKFNIVAVIHLSDLKVDSASDGRGISMGSFVEYALYLTLAGLQCHTALFTWKLAFEADGQLYEIILSACSAIEQDQWVRNLQRRTVATNTAKFRPLPTTVSSDLNLKPAGIVFSQASTLTRRLSIQRAATVGNRASVCQVIVRNTHNPQDLQDYRQPAPANINRSQSHSTTHRVVVLSPKRSERARLETSLSNVWTRDTLPYPGMVASRGGQIIRASAGSLVRKLSLASLHGPFARRSSSLTLAHRKSYEAFLDARKGTETTSAPVPVFEVRKRDSHDESADVEKEIESQPQRVIQRPRERKVSSASKRLSFNNTDGLLRRGTEKVRRAPKVEVPIGPEDSTKVFYASAEAGVVEEKLSKKKRWSNPMGLLKNVSAEGFRHMLYSSR